MMDIEHTQVQTPLIPRHQKDSFICNATSSAILLFLLFQIIISLGVSAVGTFIALGSSTYLYEIDLDFMFTLTNISTILSTIGSITLVTLMMKSMLKIQLPTLKAPDFPIRKIAYYFLLALGLSTALSMVVNIVNEALTSTGVEMTTPDFTPNLDTLNNILLIISTCIVAPIFEELLFRGLILTALRKFGNTNAMIITSLLFALIHGNIPQSIPTFAISMILCYVVIRTKSLLPAILIHFINNATGIFQLFLANNDISSIVILVVEISIMIASIVIIIRKRAMILAYLKKHKGPTIRSYFKHIAPIIVLLIAMLLIITSINL